MQIDSHSIMGCDHIYNEDYVISGSEPIPYMIISDGCSSSKMSDIGARILVLSAKEALLEQLACGQIMNINNIGLSAVLKAKTLLKSIAAPQSSLDATLIIAFVINEQVHIIFYGDGSLFYTDKSGNFNYVTINYSHNAPFYLNYHTDKVREKEYRDLSVSETKQVVINEEVTEGNLFETAMFTFAIEQLSNLIISSDGIDSFSDAAGKEINAAVLAKELSQFKNTSGVYVMRRLKRVVKILSKQDIVNNDDMTMAAMVF